jgi:hypothetical protein
MVTITSRKWNHRAHHGFFKREEGIMSFGFPGKMKTQLNFIFDANQDFDFKFYIKALISAFRVSFSSSHQHRRTSIPLQLLHFSLLTLPLLLIMKFFTIILPVFLPLSSRRPTLRPTLLPSQKLFQRPTRKQLPSPSQNPRLIPRLMPTTILRSVKTAEPHNHLPSPIEQHSDTRAIY